jgi:hypothetical protein
VHESRLKADSSASPKGFHELSKGFSPANSENVKDLELGQATLVRGVDLLYIDIG